MVAGVNVESAQESGVQIGSSIGRFTRGSNAFQGALDIAGEGRRERFVVEVPTRNRSGEVSHVADQPRIS